MNGEEIGVYDEYKCTGLSACEELIREFSCEGRVKTFYEIPERLPPGMKYLILNLTLETARLQSEKIKKLNEQATTTWIFDSLGVLKDPIDFCNFKDGLNISRARYIDLSKNGRRNQSELEEVLGRKLKNDN